MPSRYAVGKGKAPICQKENPAAGPSSQRKSNRPHHPTWKFKASYSKSSNIAPNSSNPSPKSTPALSATPMSIDDESAQDSTQDSTQDTQDTSNEASEVEYPSRDATIDVGDSARFTIDPARLGAEKYRVKVRTKNSKGGRISWIFKHGMEVEMLDRKIGQYTGRYFICRVCYERNRPKKIWPCKSTSTAIAHLKGPMHGFHPPGYTGPAAIENTEALDGYLQSLPTNYAEQFRNDFINWIAHDDITFEQAASARLRTVITTGGPPSRALLPSARTVPNWLRETYQLRKLEVIDHLKAALSKINLSLDIWSTSNDLSLLAVVAHWIDTKRELRTGLLALRPCFSHHGYDIAPVLKQVITDFEISHTKIGVFQMDNASNNDTTLRHLRDDCNMPSIDIEGQRMRCLGHIINLVTKALLFGKGCSAFEKQLQGASDDDAFNLWREQGAIGKLHNIVKFITRSPQRRYEFQELEEPINHIYLRLIKDGGIRWNSTLGMLRRALLLREPIEKFCAQWRRDGRRSYDLSRDFLDDTDWNELEHYIALLTPFELATKRVEGNAESGAYGAVWEIIITMDYLFASLKIRQQEVNRRPHVFTDKYASCIDFGFAKLNEYYSRLDETPVYRVAVMLHPTFRHEYFKKYWKNVTFYADDDPNKRTAQQEIQHVKALTEELYTAYAIEAKDREATADDSSQWVHQHDESLRNDPEDYDDLYASMFNTDHTETAANKRRRLESELERYLCDELNVSKFVWSDAEQKMKTDDKHYQQRPLEWWRERGEALYPTLALMAYDLFAIPGMSSECERVFSQGKKMITDERYNLGSLVIEADQCIKNWLRNGLADGAIISIGMEREPSERQQQQDSMQPLNQSTS